VGARWGDFTPACFYRSAGGGERDPVFEFPGENRWAIEIKKSPAPSLPTRYYAAADDIKAMRRIVNRAISKICIPD
jgi:hypothetical protein